MNHSGFAELATTTLLPHNCSLHDVQYYRRSSMSMVVAHTNAVIAVPVILQAARGHHDNLHPSETRAHCQIHIQPQCCRCLQQGLIFVRSLQLDLLHLTVAAPGLQQALCTSASYVGSVLWNLLQSLFGTTQLHDKKCICRCSISTAHSLGL